MAKDNYNIDDILAEVKRRKEEENKPKAQPETESESEGGEQEISSPTEETVQKEEPKEEPEVKEAPEKQDAADKESAPAQDSEAEMVNLLDLANEDGELTLQEEDDPAALEEAVNAAIAEQEGKNKKPKKKKSKTQKILTAIIAVLLVLVLAAGSVLFVANGWINDLIKNNTEEDISTKTTQEWQGMSKLVESFEPIKETEATELSSLEDMIKTWYHNGTPCSSTHILNVLLVGEDTRGSFIKATGTRADSAIIASINIDTKEIQLVSVLRDSWAYWETEEGNPETGQFGKINGAMSLGNIKVYMKAVENLYKIKLDGWAIVNFTSFTKIVKTMGGVKLEITEKEINEINNHPDTYGGVTIEKKFEGEKGVQKLNGKQALAYCRIRHIDSDNARADRQKTTLIAIFNQARKVSTTKLLRITKQLIPYVRTSFGKREIQKIAAYAFSKDWMDYDIKMTNVPEYNLTGGNYSPDFGGQWVWRADFPADAYFVQKRLYGKSSITLARVRVDTKTVQQTGFFMDGARATTATYTNNSYGEESTLPPTTEEEENS